MTDLRPTVAKPFQVEGTDSLPEKKFKMTLSFDLGWFEPSEVEELVEKALSRGHLERDGENLTPGFDAGDVEVPLEFQPAVDLDEEDPTDEAISRAAGELDMDRSRVVAGANKVQHRHGVHLSMEASVALYALENGVRLAEVAAEAAREMRNPV